MVIGNVFMAIDGVVHGMQGGATRCCWPSQKKGFAESERRPNVAHGGQDRVLPAI